MENPEDIPEVFRYFEDSYGFTTADYCPVPLEFPHEDESRFLYGNCKIGGGTYGGMIYYQNDIDGLTNGDLPEGFGEVIGDESFCALSSLVPKRCGEECNVYRDIYHAMCYPMSCSERSLTVEVGDVYVVCPREGGKVEVEGFDGVLLCPDYWLICSGTVKCNDMFDCVDKKSETKEESYGYDYDAKTSQDTVIDILSNEVSPGYEESKDGVCEKKCSQCDKEGNCLVSK